MESQSTSQSTSSSLISRREFLAASAATAVAIAVSPRVLAQAATRESAGISNAALQRATQRAAELVSKMTLDEVTGQVGHNAPALPKLGLARYNYWSEALHGVNVDGPITSFPQPIALGCSWNPDLVHKVYNAVSDEARAFHNKTGYGLTFFSPATVNMGLRDPRWGRVNENFSEDPFLVQTFAVQTIRAMQGDDPNYLKTIACAKHYACNDTDTDRDYADAAPDRRSFWEYYTRGFEASVTQAQVFSVMSAYNSLWGIPCPASHFLLTEVLRDRWGFKGYVVSDCDAIANIYRTHHYVETAPEAAALAVKAGSDLNCGNTLTQFLGKSVEQKLVSEEAIRTALTRILAGRFLLGEFDPPSTVPWTNLSADTIEGQDHQELAREAARQSLVLLKNDGNLLPLDKNKLKKVAVIGPMADSCHLGGYSGRSTILVSPRAGIANAFGEAIYSDTVPAGDYISTSNFRGPVVAFSDDGSPMLSSIRNNNWAQYGPLNLDNKTSIELRVASNADGDVSIYLDSLREKPVATIHILATGGMDTWKTVSAPLSGLAGSHVVFLRFVGTVRMEFINLQSFSLLPAAPANHSNHRVTYAPGSTITGPRNEALLREAVKAAKEAETVILFVGDNRLLSDEGVDRYELDLPDVQQELVKVVVAANPRTVVVVNTGCPVSINWEKTHAPAILCAYFAGEQQGNAIADALFGNYNPGGKLCSTWYSDVRQLPNFHDYDIKHGRTYMYFRRDTLYPFGHGLSYSAFSYKNLQIGSNSLQPDKAVTVSLDVTNTSRVAGDEVAQLYVQVAQPAPATPVAQGQQAAGLQRPLKQLAAFKRVPLQPGQTQTVTFSLPHDHIALRYWDEEKKQFTYDPGDVQLLVGSSSADIRLQGHISLA